MFPPYHLCSISKEEEEEDEGWKAGDIGIGLVENNDDSHRGFCVKYDVREAGKGI